MEKQRPPTKSRELKSIEANEMKETGKGKIANLFGANAAEVDGLSFQKRARKDWR